MQGGRTSWNSTGLCALIALALLLSACASVEQAGKGGPSTPASAKAEKTTLPDEDLRALYPGTWIDERAALFRSETTHFADGRFERAYSTVSREGIASFRDSGTWRIAGGELFTTVLVSNDPHYKDVGKEKPSVIVSLTDTESVLLPVGKERTTLRRKPPENPLVSELLAKNGGAERVTRGQGTHVLTFEKTLDELPFLKIPPETRALLRNLMTSAFSAERLLETIARELGERMTPEDLRAAIAWEETPIARKSTELLFENSGPEHREEMNAYVAGFRQSPPPEERMRLVREMDRACKETESVVSLAQGLQLATVVGSMGLVPPERRISLDVLREKMEKERPTLIAMYEPLVNGGLIYALRSLTDKEFEERARFHLSEAGIRYDVAALAAHNRSLLDATARFWQSLMELSKQRKEPSGA